MDYRRSTVLPSNMQQTYCNNLWFCGYFVISFSLPVTYPYYMDTKNVLKYVSTLFVKGFNWPIKLKGFLFVYLTKVIHNFGKVTPPNAGFSDKIESVNYNAAPAIARIMKSYFLDKMYKESGLEHLQQRKWMVPLCSRKSFQTGNHHTFTTYFHK